MFIFLKLSIFSEDLFNVLLYEKYNKEFSKYKNN